MTELEIIFNLRRFPYENQPLYSWARVTLPIKDGVPRSIWHGFDHLWPDVNFLIGIIVETILQDIALRRVTV